MSSPSTAPDRLPDSQLPPRLPSLGWALRRAALLVVMLFVMVFVLGWLFYAGIDPDEASAGPTTSSEQPRSRELTGRPNPLQEQIVVSSVRTAGLARGAELTISSFSWF